MRFSSRILSAAVALAIIMALPAVSGAVPAKDPGAQLKRPSAIDTPTGGFASATSRSAEEPGAYRDGEVIVRFAGDTTASAKQSVHAKAGGASSEKLGNVPGLESVTLGEGVNVQAAIAAYEAQPGVAYAQPNYIYHIDATPNDTLFSQLWGMHNTGQTGGTSDADIDAPEAWNTETGSSDVVVAVIDTGIDYNHPDLDGNLWTNPGEMGGTVGVDDDENGIVDDIYGVDFINGDGDPFDDNAHGTHCSGTIGGEGNNSLGVAGVNWDVSIMALKAFDASGGGDSVAEINSVAYADAYGADVLSCSWGGGPYDEALEDAMAATNAVIVCAAGNDYGNDNDSSPYYPASYDLDNIIAVAATDHDDALADFSNYGATSVDLAAPGVDITSTIPADTGYELDTMVWSNDFGDYDGWTLTTYGGGNWALDGTSYVSAPNSSSFLNYGNDTEAYTDWATGIDVSSGELAVLRFDAWLDTEAGFDGLLIWFSPDDGANWNLVTSFSGDSGGWENDVEVVLTDQTAGITDMLPSFGFYSDESINSANGYTGVRVDDPELWTATSTPPDYTDAYEAFDGTSMATPHVAGAAALITAYKPGLMPTQIKQAILDGVDVKAGLSGTCATGGRLNIDKALDEAAGITPIDDDVFGTVMSSAGGTPISDAWVDLLLLDWDAGVYYYWDWTFSDASGEFAFDDLLSGWDYFLAAEAYGYYYTETDFFGFNGTPVNMDIVMDPADVNIWGVVKNVKNGQYVATFVDLWQYDAWDDVYYWYWSDWPDGLGRYDFADVDAGYTYLVTAWPKWYVPWFSSDINFSGSTVRRDINLTPDKRLRVADTTRYSTAVEIAREGFEGGGTWPGVKHVIIASGEDRAAADPLAAAGLVWAYDAPLFLVSAKSVPGEVKQAIKEIRQENGAITVHIVGGPVSVPDARYTELASYVGSGLTKDRVLKTGGRYDLAAAIARRVKSANGGVAPSTVLIANGADSTKFFDALALSPIAARKGYPILLVSATTVPGATQSVVNEFSPSLVVVGGGPNTVSNSVRSALGAERWYGGSRYTTAIAIANKAVSKGWLTRNYVGVAAKLPDALSGGSMVGYHGGVLLLTDGGTLTGETGTWLQTYKASLTGCYIFGGPNSVTNGVYSAIGSKVN